MSYLVWRQDDLVGNRVQRYNTMEVLCGLKSVNVRKHPIKHEKVGQSEKNISLRWVRKFKLKWNVIDTNKSNMTQQQLRPKQHIGRKEEWGDHGIARNSTETRG